MKKIYFGILFLASTIWAENADVLYKQGQEAYRNKNYITAIELYKESCDRGNANACFELVGIYKHGEGIKQDIEKAKKYHSKKIANYERSCNNGSANDCFNLAKIYEYDEITKQDLSKSLLYYEKACELNLSYACFEVGSIYESKTKKAYKKTCSLGDYRGCKKAKP